MNILIPMAGSDRYFKTEEYGFPKPLVEIDGRPMIQVVVENLKKVSPNARFIFIVRTEDCASHYLDHTLSLLTGGKCTIIRTLGETKGAVCSSLLAIEEISNDRALVIANADQVIDMDFTKMFQEFDKKQLDAGVITFNSVHPRWSYVKLDESGNVIETTEKRPVSNNAVAGFYYFKKGSDFVNAAFDSIRKGASHNGLYFTSATLNEMVLQNKKLGIKNIEANQYHSFYSPHKIKEYDEKRRVK